MTTIVNIGTGTYPNDVTGDPLQTAFQKCNANFAALNTAIGSGSGVTLIAPSGDVTGAKDTAAFTALLATPGIIALTAGTYYLTTNLIFTAKVIIRGAGSSDGAPTYFSGTGQTANTILMFGTTTSSTISGITLQGVGSVIEDVHVQSASTTLATAGAGITPSGAHGSQVNRCSTYGFYVGILNLNTGYFTNTYNKVVGAAYAGIQVNDATEIDQSDSLIHGNFLVAQAVNGATPTAAIVISNGGGVKITGNKVNGYPQNILNANRWINSVLFQPAASTGSTGVFVISGNSLESGSGDCILLDGSVANLGVYATVTALTLGATTTITVSGTPSFAVGAVVGFNGFTTTTQMNGLVGKILSTNGTNQFTCTINSSGFTAFGAGTGSVVAQATWQGFTIGHNECSAGNGGAAAFLTIKGSVYLTFNDISVSGDVCPYGIQTYVNAYGFCSNVNIGQFTCDSIESAAVVLGQGAGVGQVNSTVWNVTYDLAKINQRIPANTILLLDYTSTAEDGHQQGTQTINISREIPQCYAATSITSGAISGGSCTLNFSTLTNAPTAGNTIIVSGATPSGLNGPNLITAATATSVTFATAATGAVSAAGSFLTALYGIQLSDYNAAHLKCKMAGQFEGYGAQVNVAERALIGSAGGGITATTIGTDFDSSGSAKAALGFNVATNNWCYITLAQGALSAAEYPIGTMAIELEGPISEIYRY